MSKKAMVLPGFASILMPNELLSFPYEIGLYD